MSSSYRSNPLGLAEFTLSRKDPAYVGRAKAVQAEEAARQQGGIPLPGPAGKDPCRARLRGPDLG